MLLAPPAGARVLTLIWEGVLCVLGQWAGLTPAHFNSRQKGPDPQPRGAKLWDKPTSRWGEGQALRARCPGCYTRPSCIFRLPTSHQLLAVGLGTLPLALETNWACRT